MDETDLLALLSGEDPSAQEKAAAMAQALRRQRAAGNLGLLTGDRVLSGFGQAQLQGAQAGEALQERRADRLGDERARALKMALGTEPSEYQMGMLELGRRNAQIRSLESQRKASALEKSLGYRERAAKMAEEQGERRKTEGLPFEYELMPGAQPALEQRKDMTELIKSRAAMVPLIDELERMTKDRTAVASPTARKRMAQIREQLGSKIRTMENLGVPSGKDMEIQLNIIGDPNSPTNALLDVMPQLLGGLRNYADINVAAGEKAYGVRKKGAAGPTSTTPPLIKERPRTIFLENGEEVEVGD